MVKVEQNYRKKKETQGQKKTTITRIRKFEKIEKIEKTKTRTGED